MIFDSWPRIAPTEPPGRTWQTGGFSMDADVFPIMPAELLPYYPSLLPPPLSLRSAVLEVLLGMRYQAGLPYPLLWHPGTN